MVLVVLLVTALLYAPLRSRFAGGVRRLVLGDRDNPYDTVAGLASTLETADEGPAQLAAVARAVAQAFGIGFVSVEVDRTGGERLVATHGERPAQTRTLPITYRDAPVGRLVLPARGLRSRLSAAATSSCSATWSGRRRRRPAPAGWPTSSRRAASDWS